jgi:transcriptional regulator with XRE-family HTH domain
VAKVGDRIREIRERLGLTQEELAGRSGVSKGFLSDVENDKSSPGSDYLLRIANALGASVDYLLKGEEAERPMTAPVMIPQELSKVAEELGLSYAQTLQVLAAHNAIVAKRSERGMKRFTIQDWRDLYQALQQFFP